MGLENEPDVHKSLKDKVTKIEKYINEDNPPFPVFIDSFEGEFEELYQAWPDKYYLVNNDKKILITSEYSKYKEAVINYDCLFLLHDIVNNNIDITNL